MAWVSPMSATIPSVSALEAPLRTASAKKYGMKRSATAVLDPGGAMELQIISTLNVHLCLSEMSSK